MNPARFEKLSEFAWCLPARGRQRVPAIVYADEALIGGMDDKVAQQLCNVATLPGIVKAAYAMPDAHWGYGFPIGGVAAFDAAGDGVVSAGGVGFDISCGVRSMLTGLRADALSARKTELADRLYATIPAGVGSTGRIALGAEEMEAMLTGGARWAVARGYGTPADLERIEENGCAAGANPECVSEQARRRQCREMGTLGSGNHYLEVQRVCEIFDAAAATAFGLVENEAIITIHCGSRGLGHQIGTEYLRSMLHSAPEQGIDLPDRELACVRLSSELGQRYLGAMRAGVNCALANRQIIGDLAGAVVRDLFAQAHMSLLFDVSHNICKLEEHDVDGKLEMLYVHRKGATRAFGPGHPALPDAFKDVGQPVLIGGSMGTVSYVLAGTREGEQRAWSSACHGAGRSMSRHAARRRWKGRALVDELAERGIIIRSPSSRGVAEEAPGAYKDVRGVVEVAERAGLARRVAKLRPVVCIKG
ncbi:MAG: RtcB family protein [Gammaproteobacteria bacterium]